MLKLLKDTTKWIFKALIIALLTYIVLFNAMQRAYWNPPYEEATETPTLEYRI